MIERLGLRGGILSGRRFRLLPHLCASLETKFDAHQGCEENYKESEEPQSEPYSPRVIFASRDDNLARCALFEVAAIGVGRALVVVEARAADHWPRALIRSMAVGQVRAAERGVCRVLRHL